MSAFMPEKRDGKWPIIYSGGFLAWEIEIEDCGLACEFHLSARRRDGRNVVSGSIGASFQVNIFNYPEATTLIFKLVCVRLRAIEAPSGETRVVFRGLQKLIGF